MKKKIRFYSYILAIILLINHVHPTVYLASNTPNPVAPASNIVLKNDTFDKRNPIDVQLTTTSTTADQIVLNSIYLVPSETTGQVTTADTFKLKPEDYTFASSATLTTPDTITTSSDTITIDKNVFAKKDKGLYKLIISYGFSKVVSFDFKITDTTPVVRQNTFQFDRYVNATDYKDIRIQLDLHGESIISLELEETPPTRLDQSSYTVSGDTITLKKEYLASLPVSEPVNNSSLNTKNFTILLTNVQKTEFSVIIKDSAPPPQSEVTPVFLQFDKNVANREDLELQLQLNTNKLLGIRNDQEQLRKLYYSVRNETVEIKKEYLLNQPLGTTYLTFEFNKGQARDVRITIIDTTPVTQPARPTITLRGQPSIELLVDNPYFDMGATAWSDVDGDITKLMTVSYVDGAAPAKTPPTNINVNRPGNYLVVFRVTDNRGVEAEPVIRKVVVIPKPLVVISNEPGVIEVTNGTANATAILYDRNGNRVGLGTISRAGVFKFTKIPEGNGYYAVQRINNVDSEISNRVNVTAPKPTTAVGSDGGIGVVQTVNATPNAQLKLYNRSGRLVATNKANKDGQFEFKNINEGSGYFVIQNFNGIDSSPSNSVTVGGVLPVRIGGNDKDKTIDGWGAIPKSSVKLYTEEDKAVGTAKVDNDGRFFFKNVLPGEDYYVTQVVNKVEGPPSNKITIKDVPIIIPPVQILVNNENKLITVTGAQTKARLNLYDRNDQLIGTATANNQGQFEFKSVPPGEDYYVKQLVGKTESDRSNKVTIKNIVKLTDIRGHWAEANITNLVEKGAISGYENGKFEPDRFITRAEFTSVLVKALNIQGNGTKNFSDSSRHWAKNEISIASSQGIVTGYGNNTFDPDALVTREQMAVMIARAVDLPNVNLRKNFSDQNRISTWARAPLFSAVEYQIITGYPDNTVKPSNRATRAEAVTIISRAMNVK